MVIFGHYSFIISNKTEINCMNPVLLDIWQIIYGFSALQGFFIASLLLFNKKTNRKPNRILATLVLSISLILTNITF